MFKGHEIVYIAGDWFSENKTSCHHIAEILSIDNTVLYVEASGQRAPRVSQRDFKKILTKVVKAFKDPFKIQRNLYLYSPLVLPFHKYKIIKVLNKVIIRLTLRRAIHKVGFKNPLLWILTPHFSSVAGLLSEKGIIYYCVDEYSAQPGVNPEAIKEMENKLLEKADVIFTVSEELYQRKRKFNPNTYLSPHGVDVQHFRRAIHQDTKIPEDITCIPKPIVGFFGLIEEWIDLDLVKFLAQRIKDASFVFIGLVTRDISEFKKLRNVYFLGARPYEILPNYLKAFDVAILPYKLNTQVINSNPMKLREYIAGGKPVVSVRIREVEKYKEFVYIADNYEEFLKNIVLALECDTPEQINARIQAMESESWDRRVENIGQIIIKHLGRNGK